MRKAAAARIGSMADKKKHAYWQEPINPFTGQLVREEDSPGNYEIELSDGTLASAFFDEDGTRKELLAVNAATGVSVQGR